VKAGSFLGASYMICWSFKNAM